MSEQANPILSRTARAIHTLFFRDAKANERFEWLKSSLDGDDDLAAFQALSVGLINFEPLSPEVQRGLESKVAEMEEREAARPKELSERIQIEGHGGEEGQYFARLLRRMYTVWQGTLEYEPGVHKLTFYSPFDEQARRHTTHASVSVDGYCPDLSVRRYILGPYLLVQDERTGKKSDDVWKVLNGDLTEILPRR